MNIIMAVDPGPVESAWVLIDETRRPILFEKESNRRVLEFLRGGYPCDLLAIEMIASYGMPVGAEVFETCVQIGRMIEAAQVPAELVYRRDIKLHHCGSSKAKDSNITQALVDRFAPGQPNRGKGTKTNPGWFHGFARDVWAAYAVAVYAKDKEVP